jgi:hypothetical protein
VFRPQKTLRKTRIKLYNTLALSVLLCGSETWTIKARDAGRITAAEMKYMRITAGYTWTDYKINSHIAKELEITPVLDKLLEYKRNWIQHNTLFFPIDMHESLRYQISRKPVQWERTDGQKDGRTDIT